MEIDELFCIFGGFFTLLAAQSNWNWFWNHPKAKGVISMCRGKKTARIFYSILGIMLIALGINGF
tara:strand:- start:520 stop:714 length:195 start_codon:yes stop_codon:yes gene_type:complete